MKVNAAQLCLTLCNLMDLHTPWNSPGQNTGVGSLSLLQGIFLTQGSNPGLPHCRQILYQLSHKGSPRILEWVACPFSSKSSQPRNQTRVSCGFFFFFLSLMSPALAIGFFCLFYHQHQLGSYRAVVTNYDKFSGLKQCKLTVLEVRNLNCILWGLNQGVAQNCIPSGALRGPLSVLVSGGCLHSLVHGPFLHLQSQQCGNYHFLFLIPLSHCLFCLILAHGLQAEVLYHLLLLFSL